MHLTVCLLPIKCQKSATKYLTIVLICHNVAIKYSWEPAFAGSGAAEMRPSQIVCRCKQSKQMRGKDMLQTFKRAGTGPKSLAWLGVGLLTFQTLRTSAQVYTLTDNNSSASLNVGSQAGMYNWTVDGINQLDQQWFWYAIGNAAPASIDTISAASVSQPMNDYLTTSYTSVSGYNLGIKYTLSGGNPGSGQSDLGETVTINNTSASSIDFRFYQYSDFDLNGTAGGNSVTIYSGPNGYNDAYQVNGVSDISETVASPGATYAEAGLENVPGSTLSKLNGGSPVTLNDNTTAGPGDVTWAFEWDLNISAGGSAIISKDKHISLTPVPEPATLSLALIGLIVCGASCKRRAVQRKA